MFHTGLHPFLIATREAADRWHLNADDRLSPQPSPAILELRVARARVERALAIVQAVIDGCGAAGLEVAPIDGARGHRAGIGIGRPGRYTAIRVEELRKRVPVSRAEIDQWLAEDMLRRSDDWRLRERGFWVCADGRLRLLLPPRYDRAPDGREGWRWSFTDQVDQPLEEQIPDVVAALRERASSRRKSERE